LHPSGEQVETGTARSARPSRSVAGCAHAPRGLYQALEDHVRAGGCAGRQQGGELVTADPEQTVPGSQHRAELLRQRAQELVAGEVA
jgi:hypothetical protein